MLCDISMEDNDSQMLCLVTSNEAEEISLKYKANEGRKENKFPFIGISDEFGAIKCSL